VTKQFFSCLNFFLAVRKMFLLQEKESLGKEKTVLSLYEEAFSLHQIKKKICVGPS